LKKVKAPKTEPYTVHYVR